MRETDEDVKRVNKANELSEKKELLSKLPKIASWNNKLPNELDQSLEKLKDNKDMNEAFGKEVINSYIKLRDSEIKEFKQKESFDKTKAITRWERDNTLDC